MSAKNILPSRDPSPMRSLNRSSTLEKIEVFPVQFVELFKDARKPSPTGSCSYIELHVSDVLDVVESDVDDVKDLWSLRLLGCFAGRFPGLKAMQELVDSLNTSCSVLPHNSGWIIFYFEKVEDLEKVLAGGPYFIFGRTLLLRTILKNFCFQDEDYNIIPIWVQLHSLPL